VDRRDTVKIIQIVSDKQVGVWFYDKQDQKLIRISDDMLRVINDLGNVPITGIIIGISCLLTGFLSYVSSLNLEKYYGVVFVFAGLSMLCAFIYARQHMRRITAEAKDIGQIYDLESDILRCIAKAGNRDSIILSVIFILMLFIGSGLFYKFLFSDGREIGTLLMSIFVLDIIVMILVTLHPVQKMLFWIKAGKMHGL